MQVDWELQSLKRGRLFFQRRFCSNLFAGMNACLFSLFFVAGVAASQTNAPTSGWSPIIRAGSVYHFDAGMDGGGEFSVNRYYAEGGMAYLFRKDRITSLTVGYGQDDYNFTGIAAEPWNNIENLRAGIFGLWAIDDVWTVFAAGSLRTYAEQNASLSDAVTGSIFGGASYRFNDRLSLGPGLGAVGQLEDDPLYFPIIVVDWNITDRLLLSTGGGMAATVGPGLTLTYSMTRHWNVGVGGRYEKKRFRLAGQGIAANGVGEDENIPIFGYVSYVLYPGTQISGLLGMNFNGRIKADDEYGNTLYEVDYGNSAFSGITASVRF